jgi:crotonobetainyl-CoA:carnitine CoA-transferase CaiB-like acyl-CoA transferase
VRLLCDHAAAADLADPAYRDDAYRYERSEHINAVIEAFTSRYPKQYLFKVAQEAGVACAPVNTAADLAADPFLHGRGWFRPVWHADLGRVLRYPGPPFRLGNPGGAGAALHPAPDQGADNRAVWVDELGMDAATFATLCATEVR